MDSSERYILVKKFITMKQYEAARYLLKDTDPSDPRAKTLWRQLSFYEKQQPRNTYALNLLLMFFGALGIIIWLVSLAGTM